MNGSRASRCTVWHFIGCGCSILLLLGLLLAGGAIFFGKQMIDGVKAGIEDPEVRAQRAQEALGYEELPEGYHPGISISLPFVMEMVTLGDRELPDRESVDEDEMEREITRSLFGRKGFLFFKVRGSFDDEPGDEMTRDMNIDLDFDLERELARGEVEAGGAEVRYVAHSGTIGKVSDRLPAIISEMEIDCLENPYARKALWFEAVSEELAEALAPVKAVEEGVVVGTPADPERAKEFLDHFDLCR